MEPDRFMFFSQFYRPISAYTFADSSGIKTLVMMLIYKCDDLLHLPPWWFYLLYALTEHIHVSTPNTLLFDIMFCVKPRTTGLEHSVDLDNVL